MDGAVGDPRHTKEEIQNTTTKEGKTNMESFAYTKHGIS
jgi:hypothetical protein